MKYFAIGLAIGALGLLFVAFSEGDAGPEQVGYFKDENRNRVFAYVAPDDFSDAQAREFLADVMHSEGHVTRAFLYRPFKNHPGHKLTGARDFIEASNMMASALYDEWSWSVVINPAGRQTIRAN